MNTTTEHLLGWYVRVFPIEPIDDEHETVLYVVGLLDSTQAIEAVKQLRSLAGEKYEAVGTAVVGRGPQPTPGEVRELKGAV